MDTVDWTKVKLDYISTTIGYRDLAKKHGCSFSTLQRKAKAENWPLLRRRTEEDAERALIGMATDSKISRAERIEYIADKLLDKIELTLDGIDGRKTGKACKDLSDALKSAKEILGVRTEKDLEEQEARIAKLRKDSGDKRAQEPVVVVMGADIERLAN